ncbi:AMY1.6 [Symbiodinium sp. CCMP2456]|nr:AMY1.6 [Symbiodinium sp. CCMP2456]
MDCVTVEDSTSWTQLWLAHGLKFCNVLTAKRVQCDGYLDDYNVINDKYLTSTKLLRHTTYQTMEEARMACLRMGPACWGISDDKCDTVNFMLVDAKWNITADSLLDSKQHTCLYEKRKA